MKVHCPNCRTGYRVDPSKIGFGGVRARCERCPASFRIEPPESAQAAAMASQSIASPPAPQPEAPEQPEVAASATAFGSEDVHAKARRLARVLVSDIKAYHPERWDRSLQSGTLKQEFREEIRKSWEEYMHQIGREVASKTSHFRDALNDILAGGAKIF